MLSRLLDLKDHIVLTTEDLCLSTGQWKQLEMILTLLQMLQK